MKLNNLAMPVVGRYSRPVPKRVLPLLGAQRYSLRQLIGAIVLLGALMLLALSAQARPLKTIMQSGKMVVATGGQFPPFNYMNGTKVTGFEVELTEMVAQKMGVALEWKVIGFYALLPGLQSDQWDLIVASHGITPERAKTVLFADPHYCTGGVIVSMDPAIRNAQALAGKSVAVGAGTTYAAAVKKLGSVHQVIEFPNEDDGGAALLAGRVDAWVTDHLAVRSTIKANPSAKLFRGDFLFLERDAAAVAKDNVELVQLYNKILKQLLNDGSYAALSLKYFGEDIRCKAST